ncbi:MAG: hypothetical protein JSV27_11120 [Candidatus Bathyarchaeota archaeon]|nr:MAG: hypothetical protein JSV27_11120 [Candidatus Bathyarchaeota archaeon]
MKDGFTEILLGVLLLYSSLTWLRPGVTSAFIPMFIIFGPRILEALKQRYTYPRIGYVKLKVEDGREIAKGIFGYMLVVFALMVVVLGSVYWGRWSSDLVYGWTPAFMGAMLLGGMLYYQGRSGEDKNYVYGILALLVGIAFSLYDFEPVMMGLVDYLQLTGWASILIGLVTFMRFRSRYPLQKAEDSELEGVDDNMSSVGRD